jgi:hypothetical protein
MTKRLSHTDHGRAFRRLKQIASDEQLARRLQWEEAEEVLTKESFIARTSRSSMAAVAGPAGPDVGSASDAPLQPYPFHQLGRHKLIDDDVVIVESVQQQGMTCGFWSVFNAKSIDVLLASRAPLNADAITAGTIGFADCITTKRPLWTEQVSSVARRVGVDIVLLGIYPDHGVLPLIADLTVDSSALGAVSRAGPLKASDQVKLMAEHVDTAMSQLTARFSARCQEPDSPASLHFVCNVGSRSAGHWVLLSVLRIPPYRPFLLVMDSTNTFTFTRRMLQCCVFIRKYVRQLS